LAFLERLAAIRRVHLTLVAGGLAVMAAVGYLALRGRAAPPPAPLLLASGRPIVAEVLNASGRPGLARLATKALRERGLDVVYFGSDSRPIDSTVVTVLRGDSARGREVARLLGRARVAVATDTLRRLDVSIRLGRDYRLPAGRFPL